jgi:hypothetical protein
MRTTETSVAIRSLARPGGIVSRGSPAHYELGAYGETAGCFNGSARPLAYGSGLAGRTYAENRPYLLPDTLGELAGPVTGMSSAHPVPAYLAGTGVKRYSPSLMRRPTFSNVSGLYFL